MRRGGQARRSAGPSFKAGLIAIVVIVVGCYFGFTKTNPLADKYELAAAFRPPTTSRRARRCASPASTSARSSRSRRSTRRASSAARARGAIVHMELDKTGLPIKADARAKIRPRIFLEGNWFVDITPGLAERRRAARGRDDPRPADGRAGPVRPGPDRAAVRHPAGPPDRARRVRARAGQGRRARLQPTRSPYWTKAFRDSAIVNEAMLGLERARPQRLPARRGALRPRPGPRPAGAQGPAHEPGRHGRGVRLRGAQPERRDPRAAARRSSPAAPRSASSTTPSRRCGASSRRCGPRCARAARRSTPRCRWSSSCAASCARASCAAWCATCGRPCPTSPSSTRAASASSRSCACCRRAPTRC